LSGKHEVLVVDDSTFCARGPWASIRHTTRFRMREVVPSCRDTGIIEPRS
jgi:hypothetical protein